MSTNPKSIYNEFIRANLPVGITYDEVRAQYVTFNGKRFPTYLQAKWYLDYITKFGYSPVFSVASLFSDGEQGVWYDPSDLSTLFQDTVGTTPVTTAGQTVALMLDKSQGLTLGPELVTNGTFDTDISGWTLAAGGLASVTDGVVTLTNDTSRARLSQFQTTVIGRSYKIILTGVDLGNSGAGNPRMQFGSKQYILTNGVNEVLHVATGTNSEFVLFNNNTTSGRFFSVDDFSVKELPGYHATQPTAAARPTYLETPSRIDLDQVDDNMSIDFGAAFAGTVLQGTPNGVLHYDISVPTGAWNLTVSPLFAPDGGEIVNMVSREGNLSATEITNTKAYLKDNGAGDNFAGVTTMVNWFRSRTDVTALYSGDWDTSSVANLSSFARSSSNLTTLDVSNWDTSSVTNFGQFARQASSLTTLDVSNWDTSSVTNFDFFAFGALSLTTVTVNGGTGNPFADSPCTSYGLAFYNTNLTQQSIDDILVAINAAGTSTGTFDQSGGSAPSATGEAAVTALRGRGWTVTVTGGF